MAKSKKKYYTVWKGHHTGVFETWNDCKAQIANFEGAQYKSFPSFASAKTAFKGNYKDYIGTAKKFTASLSASSGNPGVMEYRGVDTQSKKQLFHKGPYQQGTNNVGEFLALVHGLAFLKQNNSNRILYTDSKTAMSWVKKRQCNTKLERTAANTDLFALVDRAVLWLKNNTYTTVIVKWETKAWGEIQPILVVNKLSY
jgi:ribonuclease HI